MKIPNQSTIVSSYFKSLESKERDGFEELLIDLYRAIHCYRMYGSIEKFFELNPELLVTRSDIEDLWKQFKIISNEDLAELSLDLLQDIK